jgi:hypothetical protein
MALTGVAVQREPVADDSDDPERTDRECAAGCQSDAPGAVQRPVRFSVSSAES